MVRDLSVRAKILIAILAFLVVGLAVYIKLNPYDIFANPSQLNGETENNSSIEPQFSPGKVIVKFKNAVSDDQISEKIAKKSGKIKKIKKLAPDNPAFSNLYLLDIDTSSVVDDQIEPNPLAKVKQKRDKLSPILESLTSDNEVQYAERDIIVSADSTPNDPYYSSTGSWGQNFADMWGLQKIQAANAWDKTTGSNTVIVAIIDTGVDYNQPDIAANILKDGNGTVIGYDFADNDTDPMDDYGHGTHVAGTIGAVGNNATGVVGVNWNVKIMPIKFLNSGGYGDVADAASAIIWATDHGAKVTNNSYCGSGSSQTLNEAIKYSHDKGVITVAAAGNNSGDAYSYTPAGNLNTITVAASDNNDSIASFSNTGTKIDVAAPGVSILSLKASVNGMCDSTNTVGSNYCVASGTSMATPHVAGLAALLLANNPNLDNEQVRSIIRQSADDIGAAGWDTSSGYGRINVAKALAMTSAMKSKVLSLQKVPTNHYIVQVYGSAAGTGFGSYTLSYSKGVAGTTWTKISTSTTSIENGLLGQLDMTNFPIDDYLIKLTVTNTSGSNFNDVVWVFGVPISGQITDAVTGQAIGGLTVNILQDNTTLIATTKTAADGTFGFNAMIDQEIVKYYVQPSSTSYLPRERYVYSDANAPITIGGRNFFNFTLTKTTDAGTINGKVYDAATLQPVTGNFMYWDYSTDSFNYVNLGTDGSYTLQNLEVGLWQSLSNNVTTPTGYIYESRGAALAAKQTTTLDFYLVKRTASVGAIAGTIKDTTGKSLSGTVTASQAGVTRKVTTGSNGSYRLDPIMIGTYDITIDAPGYTSQTSRNVIATSGQTTTLSFTLSGSGSGSGDTIAPTALITSPLNLSSYKIGSKITISANASDNKGVTKVEFYLGSTLLGSDKTAPYSYSWATRGKAAGSYSITAKAYDAAGNVGVSSPVSITLKK